MSDERFTDADIARMTAECSRLSPWVHIPYRGVTLLRLLREVADARRAVGQAQAPPVATGAPSQALTAEDARTVEWLREVGGREASQLIPIIDKLLAGRAAPADATEGGDN